MEALKRVILSDYLNAQEEKESCYLFIYKVLNKKKAKQWLGFF